MTHHVSVQATIVLIFSFVDNVKISTDHPCIRADLTDASELLQKANLGLIALWSIDYSNPPRVPCRQQGEARSEGELLVHRTRGQPETTIPGKHDPPTRVRRRQVKEIKVRPKHIPDDGVITGIKFCFLYGDKRHPMFFNKLPYHM